MPIVKSFPVFQRPYPMAAVLSVLFPARKQRKYVPYQRSSKQRPSGFPSTDGARTPDERREDDRKLRIAGRS